MSGTIIKSARNTPNAPQDLGPYTRARSRMFFKQGTRI